MLIAVDKFRELVNTDESDIRLEFRIKALEQSIRSYTNNNFIDKNTLQKVEIIDGVFYCEKKLFKLGDTVQIFHTDFSDGIFVITKVLENGYEVDEECMNGSGDIAKVVYPSDIIMGAVSMIEFDLENEDHEGIASESISRHSVTYVTPTESNTLMGYPLRLTSCLKPYRRVKR